MAKEMGWGLTCSPSFAALFRVQLGNFAEDDLFGYD
jgi:hypothetical protein